LMYPFRSDYSSTQDKAKVVELDQEASSSIESDNNRKVEL